MHQFHTFSTYLCNTELKDKTEIYYKKVVIVYSYVFTVGQSSYFSFGAVIFNQFCILDYLTICDSTE